jgi:hypothetical protein
LNGLVDNKAIDQSARRLMIGPFPLEHSGVQITQICRSNWPCCKEPVGAPNGGCARGARED